MIDNFSLALSHGLILLAAWRLIQRPDLDDDSAKPGDAAAKRFWRIPGRGRSEGRSDGA